MNICRAWGLVFSTAPIPLDADPSTAPARTKPIAQPSRAPRCSRQASASGLCSHPAASGRPGRTGSRPKPRSWRVASRAALTADTSRLTAEELAGLLRVSPAAVSEGVRYLIQVGLVSRETQPGSRRHVYRMPENVWHEVLQVRDRIMLRWAGSMRGGAEVLGPGTPAGARLAESAPYFEFVSEELPALLDRWEDYKAAHQR
jgi:hypothetical protein